MPPQSAHLQRRPLIDILWEEAMLHGDEPSGADDEPVHEAAPEPRRGAPRHQPERLAEEVEAILRRDRPAPAERSNEPHHPHARETMPVHEPHDPSFDHRYERIAQRSPAEPFGHRGHSAEQSGRTSLSDMQKFAAAVSLLGDMARRIFEDAEPAGRPVVRHHPEQPVHQPQPAPRPVARESVDERLDRLDKRLEQLAVLMADHVGGLARAIEEVRTDIRQSSRSAQLAGWRQMGDQARDDFSRSVEELRALRDRISGLSLDPDRGTR